ncbi:MAG TPA: chitobiase/beta-hexosaminidase C-terminal domain-containing protein, partial [Terriglobales bacterium]|nr:chitobiase/beta-hexosaminidase C-terminal domain-containing protein [Terriglobales bacterium]
TIYYTTNGSTPTTSSKVYSTPIPFSTNLTVKALATAPGFQPSAVVTGIYKIRLAAAGVEPGADQQGDQQKDEQ